MKNFRSTFFGWLFDSENIKEFEGMLEKIAALDEGNEKDL